MPLSRFMRENSRKLVLVIMSALLIIFLIEPVLMSQRSGPGQFSETVGTAFGGAVTTADVDRTQALVELVEGLGLPRPTIQGADAQQQLIAQHLVFEEARRAGVHVGRNQVIDLLRAAGVPDSQLNAVRVRSGRSLAAIYQAVADWMTVQQLASLQAETIAPSDARVAQRYRDENESVKISLSVIDARAFLVDQPDPTDAELTEFFNQTRDRLTAHTEEALQYGYLYPDRVAVEYLTVNPDDLRERIEVSTREARRFFDDNATRYTRQDYPPGPTTQPSDLTPKQVPQTFEEARERVRDELRAAKAIEEALRIVNDMRDEAFRPWSSAKRGADHFLEPPQPEQQISFESLAQKYAARAPIIRRSSELLDTNGLGGLDFRGLSGATMTVGNSSVRFAELAMRVKGLATAQERTDVPYLNLLEPSPVVMRMETNAAMRRQVPRQAFFFRVTQVAPSAPPATLDEVREKLIADLKNKRAFEAAEIRARALFAAAEQLGLTAAVAADVELRDLLTRAEDAEGQKNPGAPKLGYLARLGPKPTPQPVKRNLAMVEGAGNARKLAEEVFKRLAQPPTATGPAHRVVIAPLANRSLWLVAQIDELLPLYEGDFATRRAGVESQLRSAELSSFQRLWFDSTNIFQRTGFVAKAQPAPPTQ